MAAYAPYIVYVLFNILFWGGILYFGCLIFLARVQHEHQGFVYDNANGRGDYTKLAWFQRLGTIIINCPWDTKVILSLLLPALIFSGMYLAESLRLGGILAGSMIEYYFAHY